MCDPGKRGSGFSGSNLHGTEILTRGPCSTWFIRRFELQYKLWPRASSLAFLHFKLCDQSYHHLKFQMTFLIVSSREMSTTTTFNRTAGAITQPKMDSHETADLLPFEASGLNSTHIQSRRKVLPPRPLEIRGAKTTRPPFSLNTSPIGITRSPQYESPYESLPHSAYTYNTFPSISPKFLRETERRNGTWAVPRRPYVPPIIHHDDNPRCNILYVSNLPIETSEDELESIFSAQPGYQRMSLRAQANGPTCSVEFDDVTSAAKALRNLYGWPLKHSKMGGIRLSFSREPLGIQPTQVPLPRTPRRAPPPPPLILHGRSPSNSASRSAPIGPAPTIAAPKPPRPSIEVKPVSVPSVEESPARLPEDQSDTEDPHAEAETEHRSHHLDGQDRAFDDLAISIVGGPDYKVEAFDESRLWLERALEMELDWYPLPSIKQTVMLSQSQLVWTVSILPIYSLQ